MGVVAGASNSGVRPPMGTDGFVLACAPHGLAWPAPLSHLAHPPTFLETGGHAVPPAGAAPPAPCLGTGGERAPFLAFPRAPGQGQRRGRYHHRMLSARSFVCSSGSGLRKMNRCSCMMRRKFFVRDRFAHNPSVCVFHCALMMSSFRTNPASRNACITRNAMVT